MAVTLRGNYMVALLQHTWLTELATLRGVETAATACILCADSEALLQFPGLL